MARGKKTGGRTKGTSNREVAPIREKFQQLLDGYGIDQMLTDLMSIEKPEQRLSIVAGLAEYVIPKLARTEVKNEDGNTITLKVIRE